MTLPTLPTDSLYKFMALAGVTMVLLSIAYADVVVSRAEDQLEDAQEQQELFTKRVEFLRQRVHGVGSRISALGEQRSDRSDNTRALHRTRRSVRNVRRVAEQQALEGVRLASSVRRVELLRTRAKCSLSDAKTLSCSGLILATLGFLGWYIKVQKLVDDLLLRRVREAVDANTVTPGGSAPS